MKSEPSLFRGGRRGAAGPSSVDGTAFWTLLRRSLGAKRRDVPFERKQDVVRLLADFEDGVTRRVDRDGEEREVVVSRVAPKAWKLRFTMSTLAGAGDSVVCSGSRADAAGVTARCSQAAGSDDHG